MFFKEGFHFENLILICFIRPGMKTGISGSFFFPLMLYYPSADGDPCSSFVFLKQMIHLFRVGLFRWQVITLIPHP